METTNAERSKYARRYRADEKEAILARYRASGLNEREFALREGVSATSIARWTGRLGKGNGRVRMVAVRVRETEGADPGSVEVRFSCGAVLRVGPAMLTGLVEALRRPC
jgi:transposase-like protein